MILIIDNYDSFTYNLVQYIGLINHNINVVKNNKISIRDIKNMVPEKIIISPGPGHPKDAGITVNAIKKFGNQIPILGICLGLQAITIAYGGEVVHANEIVHGKTSTITHSKSIIFDNIPEKFKATRYHSLVLDPKSLPDCLHRSAWTEDGVIMGVRHTDYPVYGIQFHPESILTPDGKAILKNFLDVVG